MHVQYSNNYRKQEITETALISIHFFPFPFSFSIIIYLYKIVKSKTLSSATGILGNVAVMARKSEHHYLKIHSQINPLTLNENQYAKTHTGT